jgi:hypothetical protein
MSTFEPSSFVTTTSVDIHHVITLGQDRREGNKLTHNQTYQKKNMENPTKTPRKLFHKKKRF